MSQAARTLLIASPTMLMQIGPVRAQAQRGGRGAPQGQPPGAIGRGSAAPAQTPPKPLIANAKPVRSCESLAMISLPNTIVESAAVDFTTLCQYPLVAKYKGTGSTDDAANFVCSTGF